MIEKLVKAVVVKYSAVLVAALLVLNDVVVDTLLLKTVFELFQIMRQRSAVLVVADNAVRLAREIHRALVEWLLFASWFCAEGSLVGLFHVIFERIRELSLGCIVSDKVFRR